MTIQIHTLWGTRKGYENDAPELMVAWDEYAVAANPDGFVFACQAERDAWGDDLVAERAILIDVPRDQIINASEPPAITALAPEISADLLTRIVQRLTVGRVGMTPSQEEDLDVLGEVYNTLKAGATPAHTAPQDGAQHPHDGGSTPTRAPTLGEMAEQMRRWRAAGVTQESLGYAAGQVWWE